jgi:hypothetical protein
MSFHFVLFGRRMLRLHTEFAAPVAEGGGEVKAGARYHAPILHKQWGRARQFKPLQLDSSPAVFPDDSGDLAGSFGDVFLGPLGANMVQRFVDERVEAFLGWLPGIDHDDVLARFVGVGEAEGALAAQFFLDRFHAGCLRFKSWHRKKMITYFMRALVYSSMGASANAGGNLARNALRCGRLRM